MQLSTLLLPLLSSVPLIAAQAAAGGGAPVTTTIATQDSPIRTVNSLFTINGATSATQIVFTQTFASTPLGSWPIGPTPLSGAIGLGTIEGQIGVTRTSKVTKRWALPTGWVGGR